MGAAIDMDYCMILIEKLINPMTPSNQVMPLLRDLLDSVYHPEMKKLAERIVDPEIDYGEKRRLMEEFRNFNHGGANDFKGVDYTALIDKFVDPNLPDHEYKPTMKALLEGDLDQEKKNMVIDIINTNDKDQKANKVKRFKSFFDREKEEKERAEKERKAAIAAKKKAKEELEANLLVFTDDGMQLIMKMIDKKMPAEKRSEIYDRLMEPDIDAEIKNLAIQLLNTKKSEYMQCVENFKKQREEEKLAAIRRKEEAAKKKLEEENALKNAKMARKQELLSKKSKDERMKKREMILKYRAAARKQGMAGGEGYSGPSSVQEREEWHRKERDRVRQDIMRYREKARMDMLRQEREDRLREGWQVHPWDPAYEMEMQVVVPDLLTSLAADQLQKFEAAVAAAKVKLEKEAKEKENTPPAATDGGKTDEVPVKKTLAPPATLEETIKKEEKDPEYDKYFEIFSNPELTEADELTNIKKLIGEKKSALVRQLVVNLSSVEGAGKSKMFQALAKKFVKDAAVKQEKESAENNKVAESKEVPKESLEKPTPSLEKPEPPKPLENGDKNGIVKVEKTEENRKRHGSAESVKSNESSKSKERKIEVTSKIEAKRDIEDMKRRSSVDSTTSQDSQRVKPSNGDVDKKIKVEENGVNESSSDKKKKKKHKHKDDDKNEDEKKHKKHKHKDDEKDNDEKKHKKHKHKDKHKKKDKEKDKVRAGDVDSKRNSVDSVESRSSDKGKEESKVGAIDSKRSSVDSVESKGSESGEPSKPSKPVTEMSYKEIKEFYNLKSIDSFVKIKNCKKVYRQILKNEEEKQRKLDENGKRSRSSSAESSSASKKQRRESSSSKPPSRPTSARSNRSSVKSRSASRARSVSRSISRSRSRSRSSSRSPVRYVSVSPARSSSRSRSRSRSVSPMSS